MKKFFIVSTLSALFAVSAAQAAQDVTAVKISAAVARIELPAHPYNMQSYEFRKFSGTYDLANGKTLSLTQVGSKMYAEIDDQGAHEIIASSSHSFVAVDKALQLNLNINQGMNDATGELLIVVAQPNRDLDRVVAFN